MLYELTKKISRPGILFLVLGILFLKFSAEDIITSFKSPKSFEDVLNGDVSAGDRVQGRVLFLLDAFATEQTWTENRSNNSVTPKKTSSYYYVLPCGDAYIGLTVHSSDASAAKKLVDQTYGYLNGGAYPSADLVLDTRVTKMSGDLKDMFEDELEDYYGFTHSEIDRMTLLMAEPRSFIAIQIFFGVGAVMTILGVFLLIRRYRQFAF